MQAASRAGRDRERHPPRPAEAARPASTRTTAWRDPSGRQALGPYLRGLQPQPMSPPDSSSCRTREDACISTNSPQSLQNLSRCQATCWN